MSGQQDQVLLATVPPIAGEVRRVQILLDSTCSTNWQKQQIGTQDNSNRNGPPTISDLQFSATVLNYLNARTAQIITARHLSLKLSPHIKAKRDDW